MNFSFKKYFVSLSPATFQIRTVLPSMNEVEVNLKNETYKLNNESFHHPKLSSLDSPKNYLKNAYHPSTKFQNIKIVRVLTSLKKIRPVKPKPRKIIIKIINRSGENRTMEPFHERGKKMFMACVCNQSGKHQQIKKTYFFLFFPCNFVRNGVISPWQFSLILAA